MEYPKEGDLRLLANREATTTVRDPEAAAPPSPPVVASPSARAANQGSPLPFGGQTTATLQFPEGTPKALLPKLGMPSPKVFVMRSLVT